MVSEKYHTEQIKTYAPKGLGAEKLQTRFQQDRQSIMDELDSLSNATSRLETVFSPVLQSEFDKSEQNDVLKNVPMSQYAEFMDAVKSRLRQATERIQIICERSAL